MSAATKLMVDLIRLDMGAITMTELRKNWKAGHYAAAPQAWALWAIKQGTNK